MSKAKYIIGIIVAVWLFFVIRNNFVVKSPNGTYADDNHALVMTFETSGRLTSTVWPSSSITLNNRQWAGPDAKQVTVSTWERRGDTIYISIPGQSEPVPAIKIDGDDLLMDNLRLRHTR